jgi:diguanylate cyclase (GGDEF)-like protein
MFHVRDASLDPRLADNPHVNGVIDSVRLYATAPLRSSSGLVLGSLSVSSPEPGDLTEDQLGLLRVLADQVMTVFELRRATAALGRLAATDPLTGLANRRSAEMAIGSAIRRAERGLGTPSVAIVDLDGFKAFNESQGIAAGDVLLKEVAERLTRTARSVDLVARLGGDEFVVLLEHTGGPGAVAAVDRLRRALAEPSRVAGQIEASAGYATYRPGDSPVSLLARADAEMYGEKVRSRA